MCWYSTILQPVVATPPNRKFVNIPECDHVQEPSHLPNPWYVEKQLYFRRHQKKNPQKPNNTTKKERAYLQEPLKISKTKQHNNKKKIDVYHTLSCLVGGVRRPFQTWNGGVLTPCSLYFAVVHRYIGWVSKKSNLWTKHVKSNLCCYELGPKIKNLCKTGERM